MAASDGGVIPTFINFYGIVQSSLGLPGDAVPVLSSLLALVLLVVAGLYFKSSIEKSGSDVVPDGKVSVRFFLELAMDAVISVGKGNLGHHYREYISLLAGLFLFILFTNLTGLIPGFPPATEVMSTNVAIGLVVFLVYNYAGLKEHGPSYIKHFLGPVVAIAPLFFMIELVSHSSRPLSLGLRLAGNIFSDHLLLGVFTGLAKIGVPVVLMFFGLLVAVVQSFIFTLLSGIYIGMAVSHDH
jgi:F-type H+-transporting ATPase subunit a